MGFEQHINNIKKDKDGQLNLSFDDSVENTEVKENKDKDEIIKRRKELEELYKNDPEHPEEWWQK